MPDIWMDVDAALSEVPVNILPLIDDTDFKTRETAITYDQAGMDLVWNFITPAGAFIQTAVTPTTGGVYDWTNQGDGLYTIEIPASGGGSINNDTEGFGWFTGVCTGVLPWRGPVIGFRASGLNDLLVESAFSATRGLAGTALPAAAADDAGGIPISDAGGLDLDALATAIAAILVDTGTDIPATLASILTDTGTDIPALIAALNDLSAAQVNAEVDTALADYDPPTKAELDSGLAGLNDISAAEVNAEVLDVLNVDTFGEPSQGAPPATASIFAKINYVYKFLRNKITNDGTNVEVYNDAGDTVDHKAPVSEAAGTVTRGEFISGP